MANDAERECKSWLVNAANPTIGSVALRFSRIAECGGAHAPPYFQTGMPSFLALSARFAEMPEPGNTMTPIGRTSRIRSLRLNGAALACRFQSGLKTTCVTLRLSAQQAAMRSAPLGLPPCNSTMSGCLVRTLSSESQIAA